MKNFSSTIAGHLDIFIAENEDDSDSGIACRKQVLIHGDSEGLRSLAQLLIKLADTDQNTLTELPDGARNHVHLSPNADLSHSSNEVIVGRLDAKGSGAFYNSYISKQERR